MSRYAVEPKRKARDAAKAAGCVECGRTSPLRMLDFHHLDGFVKIATVSQMVGQLRYALDDVLAEIAKCEVLCRWCHVHRHPLNARAGGLAVAGRGRPTTRRLTQEQAVEAMALHREGHSLRSLGRRFGVSYQTVQRHIFGGLKEVG